MPSFEQFPTQEQTVSTPETELKGLIENAKDEISQTKKSTDDLMSFLLTHMSEDRRKIYTACVKNLGRLERFKDDLQN